MQTCYLVGASPVAVPIAPAAGDCIIAADGGLEHLLRWQLSPCLVVGDMDSSTVPVPEAIPSIKVPAEKDDSDMALAYQEGLRRGYRRFVLTGAEGGRPDHTMANMQLLVRAAKSGVFAQLLGEAFSAGAVCGGGALQLRGRGTVSVFAYGEAAQGVSITGMRYPLDRAVLQGDTPLGLSNFLSSAGMISVEQGTLLVYWAAGIQASLHPQCNSQ